MSENFFRINVTIRADQKKWLDEHPSINVSGVLQEKIDELIGHDSHR